MKTILLLSILLATTYAQTSIWNAGNGTWNAVGSWTGGLPSQSAVISAPGSFVVTVTSSPITLLGSLTLGGTDSLPTLLVTGTTLTVSTLNFASGVIEVVNGTLIVNTEIVVNTAGTVVLNVANGTVTSLIGGTKVVQGELQLLGQSSLTDSYDVASGATLTLGGVHTVSRCRFTGTGEVQLTGQLNLANGADCSLNTNVFTFAMGTVNSTAQTVLNLANALVAAANDTIVTVQGTQIRAKTMVIASGSVELTQGATLRVNGSLEADIAAASTIMGDLQVTGETTVTSGSLILQGTVNLAMTTIQDGADLAIQQANLTAAMIQNEGNLFLDAVITGGNATANQVWVTGGNIYINSTLTVQAGVTYFTNATVEGVAQVRAGATLVYDGVTTVAGRVNNTGRVIFTKATRFAQDFYYYATSASASFTNNGTITASDSLGIFHFSGSGNIEGTYSDGTLSIEGQFATSADVNADSVIRIAGGALATAKGKIQTTKDIIVTQAGYLIATSNDTASNITTSANLFINASSTVLVQGAISVGASIQIGAQSVLNVSRGYAQAATLTMDTTAKYAVLIFSNTTSRVLNVVGNAQLNGSLEVDIDGSFTFNAGQTAVVINYGAHVGTFGSFSLKRNPDTVTYTDKNAYVTKGTDGSSSTTTGTATTTGTGADSSAYRVEMGAILLPILAFFC